MLHHTFLVAVFTLVIGVQLFAQVPDWTVTPGDYRYTMSITTAAQDECMITENGRIGVFDQDDICRGFADLITTPQGALAFITVYSDSISERLFFQVYDASEDEAYYSYMSVLNFSAETFEGTPGSPLYVYYDSAPTIDAGQDQVLVDQTATTLAADSEAGMWTILYGEGGSFTDETSPTTSFSGQLGETYFLVWTVADTECLYEMDHVCISFVDSCPVLHDFNASKSESGDTTYMSADQIISRAIIESGATVNYQAANQITFRPGFHAQSGSVFQATIADCPANEIANTVPETRSEADFDVGEKRTETYTTVHFFPNPVQQGFMQVTYTTPQTGALNLQIFDVSGKVLLAQKSFVDAGVNTIDLQLPNLPKGMYFLKLEQDGIQLYEKVMIK